MAGEIVVNSEARENLSALCDRFGSRFFATQEEKDAAEFLATKLRTYGLRSVRTEAYTEYGWENGKQVALWSWRRESAALELLSPVQRQLPCFSFANSPSTPDEGITAEIFNLEGGSRKYLLEHKELVRGKLVLDGNYTKPGEYVAYSEPKGKDLDNLFQTAIYGYVEQFGAAGFIYINHSYGDLPPTGVARWGLIGKIPACGVSRETSQLILRKLLNGPVVANLRIRNTCAPGARSYNVIADLPGREYSEEVILVGGHYDGFDIATGAIDDGAGACVVLEAARALAKHCGPLKRTVRFCCFSGEEVGLNGSTGYVINHAEELKNIKLMINTDMAGVSAKTGHGFQVCGPKELVTYLEEVLNELGTFDRDWEVPRVTFSGRMNFIPYSDHWPFYVRGIPTVQFRDIPADPIDELYSHTTADTVDKVNVKGIKDAAVVLALALMRFADEENLPVYHSPIEDILDTLEEEGIAEILRVEKRWRREFPG